LGDFFARRAAFESSKQFFEKMNWPKNNDILGFFLLFLAFINGLMQIFGIFGAGRQFWLLFI
jgi:hypothetical protein